MWNLISQFLGIFMNGGKSAAQNIPTGKILNLPKGEKAFGIMFLGIVIVLVALLIYGVFFVPSYP